MYVFCSYVTKQPCGLSNLVNDKELLRVPKHVLLTRTINALDTLEADSAHTPESQANVRDLIRLAETWKQNKQLTSLEASELRVILDDLEGKVGEATVTRHVLGGHHADDNPVRERDERRKDASALRNALYEPTNRKNNDSVGSYLAFALQELLIEKQKETQKETTSG